jgi:hypothetical protein
MEGLGVGLGSVLRWCLGERSFEKGDCSCPTTQTPGKGTIAASVFIATSVPEPCVNAQAKDALA